MVAGWLLPLDGILQYSVRGVWPRRLTPEALCRDLEGVSSRKLILGRAAATSLGGEHRALMCCLGKSPSFLSFRQARWPARTMAKLAHTF